MLMAPLWKGSGKITNSMVKRYFNIQIMNSIMAISCKINDKAKEFILIMTALYLRESGIKIK